MKILIIVQIYYRSMKILLNKKNNATDFVKHDKVLQTSEN